MDREELKNLTQAMVSSYEKHPGTVNIAQSNRLDRELIISITCIFISSTASRALLPSQGSPAAWAAVPLNLYRT